MRTTTETKVFSLSFSLSSCAPHFLFLPVFVLFTHNQKNTTSARGSKGDGPGSGLALFFFSQSSHCCRRARDFSIFFFEFDFVSGPPSAFHLCARERTIILPYVLVAPPIAIIVVQRATGLVEWGIFFFWLIENSH